MPETIVLYTGLNRNEITITSESTLEDVRKDITDSKIIQEDSTSDVITWRFVARVIKIDLAKVQTISYDDAVIGRSSEELITVKKFLKGRNALYMANVSRPAPDLIGLKTMIYANGDVRCHIAQNKDLTQKKFSPIMLERVRALKDVATYYNNVLICEEDTAIKIWIATKGHSGFGYSIESGGNFIIESMYCKNTDNSDAIDCSSRYQNEDKAIVVSGIPGTVTVAERHRHHRLLIKVWKLESIEEDGVQTTINNSVTRHARKAESRDTYTLVGDGITHATVKPGRPTNVEHVKATAVYDKDTLWGIIDVDLFIFKTIDDAEKMFEMNVTNVTY